MDRTFDFRTKVLLAHGTEDNITKFKASKTLASRHPDQMDFKLWEGLRHETHNELNKEEVLEFYRNWILDRTNS